MKMIKVNLKKYIELQNNLDKWIDESIEYAIEYTEHKINQTNGGSGK